MMRPKISFFVTDLRLTFDLGFWASVSKQRCTHVLQQLHIVGQVVELRQLDLELGDGLVVLLHAVHYDLHKLQPANVTLQLLN